jgi:hypothetical protein
MPLTPEAKQNMFNTIKTELEKCCPPMVYKKGSADAFELLGNKPVPYGYKKEIVPGMYFASTVMRKDTVSFYFFPCYMKPELFVPIAPTLFKCLKGKTCFTFKKEEQINKKELAALLKKGVEAWEKMGYMR